MILTLSIVSYSFNFFSTSCLSL